MFIHKNIRKSSGNVAKERLKILLMSDRAGCLPDMTEQIKADIINTVSKYFEINMEDPDISIIHNENSGNILIAKIILKEMNTYIR